MPNPTAIANDALSLIGGDELTAFEQQTALAARVRRHYAASLHALLEDFPWHWAERRAVLVAAAAGSDDPFWAYAYQKPANAAAIRRVMPSTVMGDEGAQPFDVSETLIYTQQPDAVAWFTARDVPPGRWPQVFADYLAADLALRLQPASRASEKIVAKLLRAHEMRKAKAEAHSTRHRTLRLFDDSSASERARED